MRLNYLETDDNLNAKIKRAQKDKPPYIVVIGDREVDEGTVALRLRGNRQTSGVPQDAFVAACRRLQQTRSNQQDFS